jgi:hypothetical protein
MWLPFIDGDLLYKGPQQYFSSIVESQNYWWGRPEYPEKTTDLSQYIDKRYHLLLKNKTSNIHIPLINIFL